jgi:hypothetical protein
MIQRELNRQGLIPRGGQLRRVGIVDRAKLDADAAAASAGGGIVEVVIVIVVQIAVQIVVQIVVQKRAAVATIGRMLCGSGLHRAERVRRRVAMK